MAERFKPDWMRAARLPWAYVSAMRGPEFIIRWHFGPLVIWTASRYIVVLWNHRRVAGVARADA